MATSEGDGAPGPQLDAGEQPIGAVPVARLTGESERRLQALRRGLRRADWFTLFLVLASGAARAEVLRRLKAWSGKEGTPELRFLPEGDESARAALALLERSDPALPLRGAVIPHAEALLDVDEGAAIAALNLARDILGKIVQGPLVLVLPAERAGELPRWAPDLFDVRSGMFEVEAVAVQEGASPITLPDLPARPLPSPEDLAAAVARLKALTAGTEPPPAGALADAWLKLSWQLHSAAQWDEALRAAREAGRLAESVGYQKGFADSLLLEGKLQLQTDHLMAVQGACSEALTLYRSLGERLGEAEALKTLGDLFMRGNRLQDAQQAYSDALTICRSIEARLGEAHILKVLGDLFVRIARLMDAERAYSDALTIFKNIKNRHGEASTLRAYGNLLVRNARLKEAEKPYFDAITLYRESGDQIGEANTLRALGDLLLHTDRPEEAEKTYSEALRIYKNTNTRLGEANTLQALGDVFLRAVRFKEAEEAYSGALTIYTEIGHQLGQANTLQSFGLLALASKQPAAAFGWFLQALSIHQDVDPGLSVGADHGYLARAAADAGHPRRAAILGARAVAMLGAVKDSFGQMLATSGLVAPLGALKEEAAAAAALVISWAQALAIGHPVARDLGAQLAELNPSFNPVVPPPEPLLAEAREQLQAAIARCEARLAEAGEDPYAPLDAPSSP